MMTVAQLREALKDLPDYMPVVMSKDAEGNGYSPLDEVDPNRYYEAYSTWSGELVSPDEDDDEPRDTEGLPLVVCLWPTN